MIPTAAIRSQSGLGFTKKDTGSVCNVPVSILIILSRLLHIFSLPAFVVLKEYIRIHGIGHFNWHPGKINELIIITLIDDRGVLFQPHLRRFCFRLHLIAFILFLLLHSGHYRAVRRLCPLSFDTFHYTQTESQIFPPVGWKKSEQEQLRIKIDSWLRSRLHFLSPVLRFR